MKISRTIMILLACALSVGVVSADSGKEKKLPPGLQKKVESGKSLPPGWQKKLEVGAVLDDEVYQQGKVVAKDDERGVVTIEAEGKTVKVIERTREIVEILEKL